MSPDNQGVTVLEAKPNDMVIVRVILWIKQTSSEASRGVVARLVVLAVVVVFVRLFAVARFSTDLALAIAQETSIASVLSFVPILSLLPWVVALAILFGAGRISLAYKSGYVRMISAALLGLISFVLLPISIASTISAIYILAAGSNTDKEELYSLLGLNWNDSFVASLRDRTRIGLRTKIRICSVVLAIGVVIGLLSIHPWLPRENVQILVPDESKSSLCGAPKSVAGQSEKITLDGYVLSSSGDRVAVFLASGECLYRVKPAWVLSRKVCRQHRILLERSLADLLGIRFMNRSKVAACT